MNNEKNKNKKNLEITENILKNADEIITLLDDKEKIKLKEKLLYNANRKVGLINVYNRLYNELAKQGIKGEKLEKEVAKAYIYSKIGQDGFCDIRDNSKNSEKIVEKVEAKPQDFFETVNEAIYEILQYRKHQDFLNIIAREAEWLKNPIIIDSLSMIDGKIQNYIKSKLQKAKEKGYIDYLDLDITTFLIYKMYIALIFEWNTEEKEIDEQMLAQTISGILKNGLRKEVEK